jgi:hypothetical protein
MGLYMYFIWFLHYTKIKVSASKTGMETWVRNVLDLLQRLKIL